MSKRLYIATKTMQEILAGHYSINLVNSPTDNPNNGFVEPINIVKQAYVFTDELLKQEDE